ncbi:hypothetical protein HIM_02492 [Hirsutella minnesotensis 3608]|nr:hypothetical protein HIM_02492 [Hirsutella minnesotensis 3608]
MLYPSPPASRARMRRMAASSSDESERGSFGISIVKFRAAAPPARPLPLQDVADDTSRALNVAFARTMIFPEVMNVCRRYNIDMMDVTEPVPELLGAHLTNRCVPGALATATTCPTLVVTAPWTDDAYETWPKVVSDLKKFVDSLTNNATWRHVNIAVEMIATELRRPKYSTPVARNPALKAAWPGIRDTTYRILQASWQMESHVNVIGLFHLGLNKTAHLNPITVYIAVDYECSENLFEHVRQIIQRELDKSGHGLRAHIEHNEPVDFGFEPLPPHTNKYEDHDPRIQQEVVETPYDIKVGIGANFGASHYNTRDDGAKRSPMGGTMGCYLELQWQGETTWTKFGLTNYSVLRPGIDGFGLDAVPSQTENAMRQPKIDSTLWEYDCNGFGPKNDVVELEAPSRRLHNWHCDLAPKWIQRLVHAGPANQQRARTIRRCHEGKIAFFDQNKHPLGKAFAGSGFRARTPMGQRRLDWALIKVLPGRQGKNVIPPTEAWVNSLRVHIKPPKAAGTPLRQPPADVINKIESGQVLFKVGARTNKTSGCFNDFEMCMGMKHDNHMPRVPSLEYSVVGYNNAPFAMPGDSGSVVFTKSGEVVGLVFGGLHIQNTAPSSSYTYVTPISDVFDHIKSFVGGVEEVRIAMT